MIQATSRKGPNYAVSVDLMAADFHIQTLSARGEWKRLIPAQDLTGIKRRL